MNDIFLSYASPDRAIAKKFADALESYGWSVWWDREIPLGTNFDRVIEEELKAARCVVVLWSKESVQSTWVRSEASSAVARQCLIPVLIDQAAIPLEFTLIQAAELVNWNGDTAHPEFGRLVQAVQQMLGKPVPTLVELNQEKNAAAVSPAFSWRTTRGFSIAAAVCVVLLALTLGRNVWQRVSPGTPHADETASATTSAVSDHPVNAPAPDPAGRSNGQTVPPAGAFPIKIGEKIGEGIPGRGAGAIEKPYGQDVYTFTAAPGQRVYFRMLRHSAGMEQIRWRLVDGEGAEVFNTCLGCTEPGLQILTRGGTYILTLGSNDNASTGTYELRLFNTPPPSRFSIKVGDKIADQVPGPGAGIIETPGAEDIFTFSASPRQRVYFRIFEYSTAMEQIRLQLLDDDSMEIFNRCLGCSEPGVQTLIKGGTYTLTVGNGTNPATGSYRLQLFNVPPPQQFSIKIGERVRAGVPGSGAGIIETPGAEDVYGFTASPGQKVYVRLLQHDSGMDQNKWRMVDDNGMEIFNMCLGCSQPGAQTLIKGGAYTIIVGSSTNPSTGSYTFEIGAN